MATRQRKASIGDDVPAEGIELVQETVADVVSFPVNTRIKYLGDSIEVTAYRQYKINADYYENGEVGNYLKVSVAPDTDLSALGEQLQGDLDALQTPELFRLQDVILAKNPKDRRSMIHQIIK